jgi:hypothetical protein
VKDFDISLKIISASIVDPYILLLLEGQTPRIFKVTENGNDLLPVQCSIQMVCPIYLLFFTHKKTKETNIAACSLFQDDTGLFGGLKLTTCNFLAFFKGNEHIPESVPTNNEDEEDMDEEDMALYGITNKRSEGLQKEKAPSVKNFAVETLLAVCYESGKLEVHNFR